MPTTEFTLNNIHFQPDMDALAESLRIKKNSHYLDDLKAMVSEAQTIARPKAFYRVAPIEDRGEEFVIVDGVQLTSRVLRVNLSQTQRVFLFAATGGVELDAWAAAIDDMLYNYYATVIAETGLRQAIHTLYCHINDNFQPGHTASMHPGSLADWPIQQQKPLFDLLGNVTAATGINLLDSYIMHPTKSVSGIRFATDDEFSSCMLCPLQGCPSRKAPYDESLYEKKYCPTPV
jgi:hypothetical protein